MNSHPAAADRIAVEVDSLDFCYGSRQTLFNVNMKVPENRVTAFIGPSGCGKSTLLRCINRMNDRIPEARVTGGAIRIDGGGRDLPRAGSHSSPAGGGDGLSEVQPLSDEHL